jgi:predicted nucleic acid-binding protein
MYLLDTNVISETRKLAKSLDSEQVKQWFAAQPSESLFLSVISLFEIERGILLIKRRDSVQATILQRWFAEKLKPEFKSQTLGIDERIASVCAQLHAPDPKPYMDTLIAATALVHDLTVVTRNTKDFEPMGVRCFNPWE